MVSFWPYHKQFWRVVVPEKKLFVLDAPVIDNRRFSSKGHAHDFGTMGGKHNIILADSMREDIDLYEITHGAIEYARKNRGVKFHFYGMEQSAGCWTYVTNELKALGSLGEVWARRSNMEEVYRAADIVLSPHRITTRVIGEALCCGTAVIAAEGSEHATWTCRPSDPQSVAAAISQAVEDYDSKEIRNKVKETAQAFSFANYNRAMEQVFNQIL
jgi:glycosyltransferase involved in cell wall biosynthesis